MCESICGQSQILRSRCFAAFALCALLSFWLMPRSLYSFYSHSISIFKIAFDVDKVVFYTATPDTNIATEVSFSPFTMGHGAGATLFSKMACPNSRLIRFGAVGRSFAFEMCVCV